MEERKSERTKERKSEGTEERKSEGTDTADRGTLHAIFRKITGCGSRGRIHTESGKTAEDSSCNGAGACREIEQETR